MFYYKWKALKQWFCFKFYDHEWKDHFKHIDGSIVNTPIELCQRCGDSRIKK
jgi:hypothetical protein